MNYVKETLTKLLEFKSVVFSRFFVVSCHKEIKKKSYKYPDKFNIAKTNYFIKKEEIPNDNSTNGIKKKGDIKKLRSDLSDEE